MTPDRDTPARLTADLETYMRQQMDRGVEWVIDEGSLPPDAAEPGREVPAAAPVPAPVEAAPAPEPAPVSAAPRSAPEPTSDPKAEKAAAFARECEAFVEQAMAQIGRYRPPEPESDLFSAPETAEPDLSREQKRERLEEIAGRVAACRECKLCETRNKTVAGDGDPDAGLVLVGEAPGRDEDRQGIPFVGPAGRLLDDILKAIDLRRDRIFICNILKCRPPNNRDPEADEVSACEPFLREQLEIIKPRLICCLGRHAAMTLLETRASLRSMRESLHFYQGIPVMATFHPAALLRNSQWKRPTWDDVRKLRALYDALSAGAES